MCIQTESRELEFTLLVPLIAVKFSARTVVIHLTALLEYLRDCSIRVFNLSNSPMYNNHEAKKKTPCNALLAANRTCPY